MNAPLKKKKSKKAVWIVILAVLLIGGFFTKKEIDSYNYSVNLQNAVFEMVNSAAEAEKAAKMIHSVWYNSIFKIDDEETNKYTRQSAGEGTFYSDFNDALGVLFSDQSFQADMASLAESQSNVAQLMRDLKDPPKKYQEDYAALKSLYSAYMELYELVLQPRGNLESFTETYNTIEDNFLKYFNPLSIYVS